MALTPKQKIFANEYLIDLNATRAYKAAYTNCKTDDAAAAAGARLLRNVKVAEYIQERMKDREKDVYKRQIWKRTIRWISWKDEASRKQQTRSGSICAVSYTHLDVYKRQKEVC